MTADQPTVTIYTSPTCVFCHMAKEYLEGKGIDYTERDITTDPQGLEYVVTKVGQAVTPIITINDEVVIGFDRPKLEALLANPHREASASV